MMLRTGSRQSVGFTLIEVLTAGMILSVGIVGVIRAYVTLINGIEASRFTMEASYLLKEKIADVEEEVIEKSGVPETVRSGAFSGDYAMYRWQTEVSEVRIERAARKEKQKAEIKESAKKEPPGTLDEARISVTGGEQGSSRKLDLYTYLEK